jgi:hypothetical protein
LVALRILSFSQVLNSDSDETLFALAISVSSSTISSSRAMLLSLGQLAEGQRIGFDLLTNPYCDTVSKGWGDKGLLYF